MVSSGPGSLRFPSIWSKICPSLNVSNSESRIVESPAVVCPACGATILVGFDARGGQQCSCGKCGAVLEVEERVSFRARPVNGNGSTEEYHRVGRVEDVPVERPGVFRIGKREIAVFRSGERYFAMKNLCPHHGIELSSGSVSQNRVRCPGHGYSFDLQTGQCDRDPSLCASTFEVKVDSGELYVRVS